MADHSVWAFEYAPEVVEDVIAPEHVHKLLIGYRDSAGKESIPNFTLWSQRPGVGKTTAVRTLLKEVDYETLFINGSAAGERGIAAISEKIMPFVVSQSLYSRRKAVVIDEADNITNDAQMALRETINQAQNVATFIMTCNDHTRLIEPLRSRCPVYDYVYHNDADRQAAAKKLVVALVKAAKAHGADVPVEQILDIVKSHFPDLRGSFLALQTLVTTGVLLNSGQGEIVQQVVDAVVNGDAVKAMSLVDSGNLSDTAEEVIKAVAKSDAWGGVALVIVYPIAAKYLQSIKSSVDRMIALKAFICEVVDKIGNAV